MKSVRIGTRLLAAIIVLVGMWAVVPTAADAHPAAGAAGIRATHGQSATSVAVVAADCAVDFGSGHHGTCCGAAFCCPPCLLVPLDPASTPHDRKPVFASAQPEAPAGLPSAPLRKPPRLAR